MLLASYYIEPSEIDRIVFDKLIPPNHFLRRVKALIDFDVVRDYVQDCYSPSMGRPAEDPVLMLKLGLLQFHYNLSDREVLAHTQVNVAFRYFLDLSLESHLPSYGLLSQFRTRLGLERYQSLFEQIVAQARAQGLIQDSVRVKDATHVMANIAVASTLRLIAQVRKRLLESSLRYAPEQVEQEQADIVLIRQATVDLSDRDRLLHRVAHLRRIVVWADALQSQLGVAKAGDPDRARFEQALGLAHKVLADQDTDTDKLRALSDPDARKGKHGQFFDGYLLDVLIDPESEMITSVAILPANAAEAANAKVLIETEEAAHGNDIAVLSIDGVGFNGPVLRALEQDLGVTVYVPVPSEVPSTGVFEADAFILDATETVLTCPGGVQTSARYRNSKDTAWRYEFKHSQCQGCALQGVCVPKLPKSYGRRVYKNDYQAEYEAVRTRSQTDAYAAVRRLHPRIERKLSEIVRYHAGRWARYRGRERVAIEYVLRAMVVNIKRMVRLLAGPERALEAYAVAVDRKGGSRKAAGRILGLFWRKVCARVVSVCA